jgi:hypothetical protein
MITTKLRFTALTLAACLGMGSLAHKAAATDLFTVARVGNITVDATGSGTQLATIVSFTLENAPQLCKNGSGNSITRAVLSPSYLGPDAIKSYLSILTAAKLAGRQVQVRGVNTAQTGTEVGCHIDGVDIF